MESTTYADKFRRKLNRLFTWKCNTEGVKIPKRFELLLHENGSLGYDLIHKCWVIGNFNGIVDDENDFTTYVCHTLSSYPESAELTNHSEVVVCGNNDLYSNDREETNWYSDMLSDTDISIYYQLINSRNIPMLSVGDDNVKKQVELAFQKMKAGCPVVIATDLLDDAKVLDITDNGAIDRISSLDNFYQELIKRWCNTYGVDVETKEKKAQVNEMELDSFGDYDTLNYLEMYQARLDFCNEMRENGIDIEVIRNPIYWDEPTETDIEEGEFEQMEGDENNEDSEVETDNTSEEQPKSADDDERPSE